MRTSALKYAILSWSTSLTMLILLAMPFYALITVWGASLIGHYTAVRLWKEFLLALCGIGVLFLWVFDHKIRSHTLTRRLVQVIFIYALVNILWGLVAFHNHAVTAKAFGYGLIVNLRFLVFFLVTWASALRMTRLRIHWQWVVLWPAIVVVLIGLLQIFVLPHDILKHFGYGANTIPPVETINHNGHYIRIMSTLRGANPLGAYLLVPISLLCILILRGKRRGIYGAVLFATLVVEFFTFSRSSWIGAALTVLTVLALSLRSVRSRRVLAIASGAVVAVALIAALALHNNVTFENYVLHTQKNSAVQSTSDQGHVSALQRGMRDIVHEPFGRGTGTAGPASVYNGDHPVRIAENYYVQIAQETGWLGLILFLLINTGVGVLLWIRRDHPLALSLLASLIGISLIGLFSHVWTDDTLAYVWWGLAGIAMAPGLNEEE